MNNKNAAILFGGISLACYPLSLTFSTTIIYYIAKGTGLIFAITAGYFAIKSIKKRDKTIGILAINLAIIDLFIHLMMF